MARPRREDGTLLQRRAQREERAPANTHGAVLSPLPRASGSLLSPRLAPPARHSPLLSPSPRASGAQRLIIATLSHLQLCLAPPARHGLLSRRSRLRLASPARRGLVLSPLPSASGAQRLIITPLAPVPGASGEPRLIITPLSPCSASSSSRLLFCPLLGCVAHLPFCGVSALVTQPRSLTMRARKSDFRIAAG
eukprot:15433842-Alexandrium_andersonii.AAC.2